MRRHLTASQKAVIALDLLPMLEKEAKERQRLSNGRGKKGAKKDAAFSSSGKASEVAARIANANARYVESAKSISKSAPDLLKHIRSGALSLPDAKWVSELPSVDRQNLLSEVNGEGLNEETIHQWKAKRKTTKPVSSLKDAGKRLKATVLIHGDCCAEMKKLRSNSIDAIITDPIYPEVDREYGRISEPEWHELMQEVVLESRRLLKPTGSAIFILQPNYKKVGQMRLWLWEFLLWAAKEWNLVQDVHWRTMTGSTICFTSSAPMYLSTMLRI